MPADSSCSRLTWKEGVPASEGMSLAMLGHAMVKGAVCGARKHFSFLDEAAESAHSEMWVLGVGQWMTVD